MHKTDCSNHTDEELVIKIINDNDYFLCLMLRYESKLISYIRRLILVNKHDAEDILQEVFIKVFKNLNEFDASLKFSSWIYRISHNEAISFLRKRSGDKIVTSDDNEKLMESLASEVNLEVEFEKEDVRKSVNEVFDLMEIKYKEVLFLRYFEEKDYKEISDILRKPEGTVATLLNRAKKEFKTKASHLLTK